MSIDQSTLKEHQREGVAWMMEKVGKRQGFVLGDDMGLGKTLQILCVVERLWERGGQSVLVLAPRTLVKNWALEIEKFAPSLPHRLATEAAQAEKLLRASEGKYVVIMGYEMAQRKHRVLRRMYFDLVVMDEAQRIKNKEARISVLCRSLDAGIKTAVTGTPIQNNLMELWSIVETVRPKHFWDSARFKTEIDEPLKRSKLKRASPHDKARGEAINAYLKESIASIILRRTKEEAGVLLPPKHEAIVFCPLSEEQQSLYLEALQDDQTRTTILGKSCPLKTISRLRQICSHPGLVTKTYAGESGKVDFLHRLLQIWEKRSETRKVLVFCQYREMLQIIGRTLALPFAVIDGQTPPSKRIDVISAFGQGAGSEVLLLSTRIGGVGVNIPQANTVVLFDLDWNPFNEEQAKGRAHRMGQVGPVDVFRFICKGTIEDSIYTSQEMKKDLSSGVFHQAPARIKTNPRAFDKIDLCRLFHYSHDPLDVTELGPDRPPRS
ncbi:hypothetical protein NEDG_00448 [Nematocida displodere]|uniref:Uncharacterized protein n=1 Tax=Nematocida displodere TaxID=1805483 RepID=A0A177EJ26_9MICR|nr:hypothetical protein NEDG_00448 [Nematocida displodere]